MVFRVHRGQTGNEGRLPRQLHETNGVTSSLDDGGRGRGGGGGRGEGVGGEGKHFCRQFYRTTRQKKRKE